MLRKSKNKTANRTPAGSRFAIIAARFNSRYTNALLRFARRELQDQGASAVDVFRVPGAFEVPVVAGALARSRPAYDAILALAVILQGETRHAELIADSVSHALAGLAVDYGIPVIHGVALLDNHEQARVRCLSKEHNRGTEAARTAIEMTRIMRRLHPPPK